MFKIIATLSFSKIVLFWFLHLPDDGFNYDVIIINFCNGHLMGPIHNIGTVNVPQMKLKIKEEIFEMKNLEGSLFTYFD